MYTLFFLARFFPFWGIPAAFVFFEVGMHFYHRRLRNGWILGFGMSFLLIMLAVLWVAFEGYWKAGPFLKETIEHFRATG